MILKGNEHSHLDLLDIELALDDLLLPYKIDLSRITSSTIRSSSSHRPSRGIVLQDNELAH
ncbi:hypothetical protein ACQKEK_03960 [Pseudomonas sp. NPDC077408]